MKEIHIHIIPDKLYLFLLSLCLSLVLCGLLEVLLGSLARASNPAFASARRALVGSRRLANRLPLLVHVSIHSEQSSLLDVVFDGVDVMQEGVVIH